MELADIIEVNELFSDFYPYVVRQVLTEYRRTDGSALEIGPFAGGVALELATQCPDMSITLGDDFPGLLPYFQKKVKEAGLSKRIKVLSVNKLDLPFPEGAFDLVVFRGGLFFWEDTKRIVEQAYRVLKHGGVAMIGGGFGTETPDDLIDACAERSRDLNRKLGKRVMSEADVLAMLRDLQLVENTTIDTRHGLWAAIRKMA